jgi:glycosyltransferase involved in cell wall biosynthesis
VSGLPLFSIVTPVYNTPLDVLQACIDSVRAQDCAEWELIVADDASPDPRVGELLAAAAANDDRVRVIERASNGGIVEATNSALAAARGEFVAFLDHDDLLAPHALSAMLGAIKREPSADLLYSDEDKIGPGGRLYDLFRKPDWSPIRLTSHMYVGHLSVMRRQLVEDVGRLRKEFEGSQDYDLALRVSEVSRQVVHVPEVLYHWRALDTSVASSGAVKPYAFAAARRALAAHCERTGVRGRVEQIWPGGIYRTHREIENAPLVSIIIPTRGAAAVIEGRFRTLVTGAVRSITTHSTYDNYEVVVVADAPTPREVIEDLDKLLGPRLRLVPFERPFNFADKINCGALAAAGEYLLLLNDDVEVISPDWIEALLGPAQRPGVGMTGAMLFFADHSIQHAGHVYSQGRMEHIGFRENAGDGGYFGGLLAERECSGVTAACALVRRDLFMEVGGMSMLLPNNFNDVDFSLKIRNTGHRIIWTPHAELFHYESKTRINSVAAWEAELIWRRWRHRMQRDPYWPTPPDPAGSRRGGSVS